MNFKKFLKSHLQLSEKDHDFLHHIAEEELSACKVHEVKLVKGNPTVVEFHADCKDVPRDEGYQHDLSKKLAVRLARHHLKCLGQITPRVIHKEVDHLAYMLSPKLFP